MSQELLSNPIDSIPLARDDLQSVFYLKRSNSSLTAPSIQVSFSLAASPEFPANSTSSLNQVPQFNNDKKFYTPSFILPSETIKFITNDSGYRMIHEKKIQEMEEENEDILVPKPSRANSYCCVCRESFEDYLTHLSLGKHQQLMKKSPFYRFIEDLCEKNGQSLPNCQSKKTNKKIEDNNNQELLVAKKKKIIKIQSPDEPKRKRGRPRKEGVQVKLEMLASIPTSVSISL